MHGIEGLHPLSLIILGPHHTLVGAKDITVKQGAFGKEFLVLLLAQYLSHLSNAPVGIAVDGGDRDTLPAFPVGIYLGNRLRFAWTQCRIVAMRIIESVQRSRRSCAPRQHGTFQRVLAEALVGCCQVEAQTLDPGIQHPYSCKVTRHGSPFARSEGKAWHDAALAVHLDQGVNLLHLDIGIQNGMQGFQGNMGIPQPVVDKERLVRRVYLAVPCTEETSVFVDIYHTFRASVEGSIESALV